MHLESTQNWHDDSIQLFLLDSSAVTGAYVQWLNDPQVNRYLESRFQVHDLESTRKFVEQQLADPQILFLGLRTKESGLHVGNIKLGPLDRHHGLGEIGIMIGDKSAWGKGFATRAITLISNIARLELKLRKLTAGCYGSNVGSARAFCKAGFFIEGRREQHYILDQQTEDHILLARFL